MSYADDDGDVLAALVHNELAFFLGEAH